MHNNHQDGVFVFIFFLILLFCRTQKDIWWGILELLRQTESSVVVMLLFVNFSSPSSFLYGSTTVAKNQTRFSTQQSCVISRSLITMLFFGEGFSDGEQLSAM